MSVNLANLMVGLSKRLHDTCISTGLDGLPIERNHNTGLESFLLMIDEFSRQDEEEL